MHVRSHRSLALTAVLLTGGVSLALAQAGEPWGFASAAEKRDAEKRWSQYWTENYPRAEQILDGGDSSASSVEEAIQRLKLAIANERASAARKLNPKLRINVPYFPYYQLARAYVFQGRPDLAKRCLDREATFGEIGGSKLAANFTGLQARVEASASVPELLALVEQVEGWVGGNGGVSLSAAGSGRVAQVKTLKTQLEQASTASDTSALTNASGALANELIAFSEAEVAPMNVRLKSLSGAGWSEAFSTAVDAGVCSVPSGGSGVERARAALQAVEACSQRGVSSMRTAGGWACNELKRERQILTGLADNRTKLLGSPPSIPAMPSGCGLAWTSASASEMGTALDGIDVNGLRQQFRSGVTTVRAELGQKRDAMQAAAVASLARKPALPAACVTELNLSQIARQLSALPSDPADVGDTAELDRNIDALFGSLTAALKSGVNRLDQDRDDCEGLDTSNLDALQAAMKSYEAGHDTQRLNAVCGAATRASADINRCWSGNSALVAENVDDAQWLLDAAVEMRTQVPVTDGTDLSCLTEIRGKLRPSAPRRDKAAWSQAQRGHVNDAQACLSAHGEAWRSQFDATSQRVATARGRLEPLKAAQGGGALAQLGSMADKAIELESTFSTLGALYASEPTTVDGLRQSLESQGIADRIPASWWSQASSAPAKRLGQTLGAIRDMAASSAVNDSEARLLPLERVAESVSPLIALQGAFTAFDEGDVDDAIVALRSAQAGGEFPEAGRPAALGHAALSYFLFTKATAASVAAEAGDSARLLRDDAEREARASLTADGAFEPPASLFASASFRSFFSQQSR